LSPSISYIQTKLDHIKITDSIKIIDHKEMSKTGAKSLYFFSEAVKSRNNLSTMDQQINHNGTKDKNGQFKKLAKLLLPQASQLQTSYENTL